MKKYTVRRYTPQDFDTWNAFIEQARNGTFLFNRNYMEYHSDRFNDHSLIILEKEKWIAVLPAHLNKSELFSHNGLTYGGLIYGEKMTLSVMVIVFRELLSFLNENQIKTLHLKLVPSIYHDKPSEELAYVLFPSKAKLTRRDALSVIDNSKPYKPSRTRLNCIRRGEKNGLIIKEEAAFELFWTKILIPNINAKHGVDPVHTFAEMEKLHRSFPENIRHFNVYHNDEIVAGTTIYVTKNVIHPQYISGKSGKNALGSLDFLYDHLIAEVFRDYKYFDFGISNEFNGMKINEGILFWKETFSTGTVIQDFYEIDTENFNLLNNVLI